MIVILHLMFFIYLAAHILVNLIANSRRILPTKFIEEHLPLAKKNASIYFLEGTYRRKIKLDKIWPA
ncbi:MAG: hypothetical protein EAZ37_10660 [Burkholderiales bacterium]|nr:MAG: hypothetical protein EAZ37_10660 [Burkholderiales bacterium]